MPYNGAGVYLPPGADFPAVALTLIQSTKYNNVVNDQAVALSNCVTRDGQSPALANIPMGGFKHTNVSDATAVNQYATWGQVQGGSANWAGTAGGTADALTLTVVPPISSYVAGQTFAFKAGSSANTGPATINISGLGAKDLESRGAPLVVGDIQPGMWYRITYDGTAFQLQQLSLEEFLKLKIVTVHSTDATLTVADIFNQQIIDATADITLPDASTLAVGDFISFKSITTGRVRIVPDGTDTIDGLNSSFQLPAFCDCTITKIGTGAYALTKRPTAQVGQFMWAGFGTAPQGWIKSGGSAISRSTYAGLFEVYGTSYGPGDGSTTFDLPATIGRRLVQAGTGTVTETCTASSGNGFVVAANEHKWETGMPVVPSGLSGFTTTATDGVTYYVVRISPTNIRLATTLALAQNLNPNVTVSGTGSVTFTHTFVAKTLGETGGKESQAQTINQLIAHTHTNGTTGNSLGADGGPAHGTSPTGSRGGNEAMPTLDPFFVGELYIKL